MKSRESFILVLLLLMIRPGVLLSQEDHSHYSEVFKRDKPYRIFLPDDYATSGKSYPVIYYFHGNTGTHVPRLSDVMEETGERKSCHHRLLEWPVG